jgi:hypothetical protein
MQATQNAENIHGNALGLILGTEISIGDFWILDPIIIFHPSKDTSSPPSSTPSDLRISISLLDFNFFYSYLKKILHDTELGDSTMAELLMSKANTSANLSAIFNIKAEQAKLAQAKGDKAKVDKILKELLELNLEIVNNNKWMFEQVQVAQDQTSVLTEKQEDLRSPQILTSGKQISEFVERMNVLNARIESLKDELEKGVDQVKNIQPYVEDDSQEEQNTTRQGERPDGGRRGENDAELKALDEADEGSKGLECEMSGALGDVNISDSTITQKIPGIPTSDDLDRLVYDAGDRSNLQQKPRLTGHGCTSFRPKTFGKVVDQTGIWESGQGDASPVRIVVSVEPEVTDRANAGPWWLGLEGFEKYTRIWLGLDENERRRIATMKKDAMEERESQRTFSEGALSTPQHPCSCGDTCSVVENAEILKRLYADDSLIEEEDADHREERFRMEHEFLKRTVLATMRKLEDGVAERRAINLREVGALRDILGLEKGKSQENDPYEPEFSIGSDEDYSSFTSLETYEQLETYYEYIRRHPHLEIDSDVLDLTKELLTLAEWQDNELRVELLEQSKQYEERVQNGEEVKPNILAYLQKLLRLAGDKNVENDAEIGEEESELEEEDSKDPTDIFISYLRCIVERLDFMIKDGSQIEVDAELLGVARRVIECVASPEQQKPKDQQPNKPRVVIQYMLTTSNGKPYKNELILDHVVENDDGTVTFSAEECEGVNSSIICRKDILNDPQNWLDLGLEQWQNKQPQKPWFVITHSVKTADGNTLSDKQLLDCECMLTGGLASMTGGTSTFPRRVFVNNKVHVERDGRIICRAMFFTHPEGDV